MDSKDIAYLTDELPNEWCSANTDREPIARATWHFPEPVRKGYHEDIKDKTDDSYENYFWHYKRWVSAAQMSAVLIVAAGGYASNSNNKLDIPIRTKVYLNWGPHPQRYTEMEPTAVVETVLKISANSAGDFGISAQPLMTSYSDYDPNVTYSFNIYTDGDVKGLDMINYFIDWGDGCTDEITEVSPYMAIPREHTWDSGTYTVQIFCYGKRADRSLLISSVTQYTIPVYDEDDGGGSGESTGPIRPGYPNLPPTPLSSRPTAENSP